MLKRIKKIEKCLEHLPDLEDTEMELTLLSSCLSLPKLLYSLHTCPPLDMQAATIAFDELIMMRASPQLIAGGPLPNWSLLNSSLLSSRGGLNLRCASHHAPAAFVASFHQTLPMVKEILGVKTGTPGCLPSTVASLALAAGRPNWISVEDIDVPIRQRVLSASIDESNFDRLLATSSTTQQRSLALSSTLQHAGVWLNVLRSLPLVYVSTARSFGRASDIGLGCAFLQFPLLVVNV